MEGPTSPRTRFILSAVHRRLPSYALAIERNGRSRPIVQSGDGGRVTATSDYDNHRLEESLVADRFFPSPFGR